MSVKLVSPSFLLRRLLFLIVLALWLRFKPRVTPRICSELEGSLDWRVRTQNFKMKAASGDTKKSKSDRKNSWVMLAESGGYTPLPGEQTLYQSPPRTTLSLQTSHRHPPSESYSQQCKSGVVYLTNRRVCLQYLLNHAPLWPSQADRDSRLYTSPSPRHRPCSPSPYLSSTLPTPA